MDKKKIVILLLVGVVLIYLFVSQSNTTTTTTEGGDDSNGLYADAIGKLNSIQSQLNAQKKEIENKLDQEEFEARKNMDEMRRIAYGLTTDIFSGGPVVDDYIRECRNLTDGALKVVAEEFQKMAPANQTLRQACLWKVIITTPNQRDYPISRVVENYTKYLPARLGSLGLM